MHGVVLLRSENSSSRRVILKIELELNNLNSILSRSAMTPVFPNRAGLILINYRAEVRVRTLFPSPSSANLRFLSFILLFKRLVFSCRLEAGVPG